MFSGRKKTPGGRPTGCYLFRDHTDQGLGDSLARLAERSLAARADVQANADTVHDDALLVHVRAEIPVRAALGKAHIIAKRLGFTADITFPGHGHAPFRTVLARRLGKH
jgi:hypothetical protein